MIPHQPIEDVYPAFQLRRIPLTDKWDVYGIERDGSRWIVGKSIPHSIIHQFFLLYDFIPESKEVE